MLTRLNAIDGVAGSSALLAKDGNRMVQIDIKKTANMSKVVEEVQKALRVEVHEETPVQVEGKSVEAVEQAHDWLTVGQLNEQAREARPSRRFAKELWLLALAGLVALGASLVWLLRRQKNARLAAAKLGG